MNNIKPEKRIVPAGDVHDNGGTDNPTPRNSNSSKERNKRAAVRHGRAAAVKGQFTFIDAFAGIGGFRCGLEAIGGRCVASAEIDPVASEAYRANWPADAATHNLGDITRVGRRNVPKFDLLVGGYPCQPWSRAGKKKGFADPRGNLFLEIPRILRDCQPRGFILENVAYLARHDKGRSLSIQLEDLRAAGYSVTWKILDAQDFGCAQRRKRIFIVGFRSPRHHQRFTFPAPTGRACLADVLRPCADPKWTLDEHRIHRLLDDGKIRQAYVLKLDSHDVAPTVVANYGHIQRLATNPVADGPTKYRLLTYEEALRLQGFPPSFHLTPPPYKRKPGDNKRRAFELIGNAAPPPMVEAVGRAVVRAIWGRAPHAVEDRVENEEIGDELALA